MRDDCHNAIHPRLLSFHLAPPPPSGFPYSVSSSLPYTKPVSCLPYARRLSRRNISRLVSLPYVIASFSLPYSGTFNVRGCAKFPSCLFSLMSVNPPRASDRVALSSVSFRAVAPEALSTVSPYLDSSLHPGRPPLPRPIAGSTQTGITPLPPLHLASPPPDGLSISTSALPRLSTSTPPNLFTSTSSHSQTLHNTHLHSQTP